MDNLSSSFTSSSTTRLRISMSIPPHFLKDSRDSRGEEFEPFVELTAVLGPVLRRSEWHLACDSAGLTLNDEWIEALVARGWISAHPEQEDCWSFHDTAQLEQLQMRARRKGRWRAHHAACALALVQHGGPQDSALALRCAEHFEATGEIEQAADSLLCATDLAYRAGDHELSGRCLARLEVILDSWDSSSTARLRARLQWRVGRRISTAGDFERGREYVQRALESLDEEVLPSERGHAALIYAKILRNGGELGEARRWFEEAGTHFAMGGDEHGLAMSRGSLGALHLHEGEYGEARRRFLQALDALEKLHAETLLSELLSYIAQTWLGDRDPDKAREWGRRAIAVARANGLVLQEATAWSVLGEAARELGDVDEARRCYEQSARLFEQQDSINLYIIRLNIGVLEAGGGNFTAARRIFEEIEPFFVERALKLRLPLIYIGLLTCAVGQADWPAYRDLLRRYRAVIEEVSASQPDIVWLARQMLRLAAERDRQDIVDTARAIIEPQRE